MVAKLQSPALGDNTLAGILAQALHSVELSGTGIARTMIDILIGSQDTLMEGEVFDPNSPVTAGDRVVYNGGVWEAQVDIPEGCPPLGIGDGSIADRLLLLSRVAGFATGTTGGGLDGTLVTVHNDNDTGTGSLRQAILDHLAAKTADPTHKTWIIFDPTFNGGVYEIVPATTLFIAGLGSADITIDARACDVTYTGGGAPGVAGVGVHIKPFAIGGANTYAEGFGDGNTEPSNNIIISCVKFIANAGGDDPDNGFYDVFDMELWANHIYLDHCEFTNGDFNTDGNVEIGYGATNIHASWCIMGPHDKSELIIDNFPPGHSLPPGVSVASPGIFDIWVDSTSPLGRVITYVSQDHCYKPHVADRAPYAKGAATRYHGWNIWSDQDGFYAANIADISTYIYYGTDPTFGGHQLNIGGPFQCGKGAHMRLDGCIVTPYSLSPTNDNEVAVDTLPASTGATRGVFSKREGVFGFSKTTDILYEGSKRNDGGDHLPTSVFTPPYDFQADTANSTLKERLLAYAGAKIGLWSYVEPATVRASVDVLHSGAEIGLGATPVPATKIDFDGAGITDVVFDGVDTVTVTVDPATANPPTFNLVGNALPTPDITYLGKRFRLVTTFDVNDVPTNGIEYECRHNATLNVYEWEQVYGLAVAPVPGQILAMKEFRTNGAMTDATTTSTSAVDITASGITASWTGLVAASLDLTFVVPANGIVLITLDAFAFISSAGANLNFSLYDVTNSANLTNHVDTVSRIANGSRCHAEFKLDYAVIAGAPGDTMVVRPRWYVSAGTGSIKVGSIAGGVIARAMAGL